MTKKAKGGLTKGKSHKEGGIPMKVKSTGQNIEVEGGEIIINKYSSADTKLHDFDGKKMTKCEVASAINSADNNGVKIDCDTIVGRKYKYEEGGRIPLQNSLGIERQYLPQVRKKDYPEFFEMLSKDNISFQETTIDPLEYNPTQSYVKKDNIDEIYKANKLKDKPLLVSSDGFVLDGHHRWYYATQEKMPSVKAIIINLPIYELIEKVNLFRMAEHQYNKGGKIDKKKYVSFFADTDGDGIPNVDDISPFNRDKKGQIEEVRVSDELEQIIDFRNKAEDVRFDTIEKLEKIAGTCGVGKDRCGILSRTKTPYSIINKMRRRSLTNTKDLEKLDIKAQELLQTGELSGLDLFKGLTDVVGTMVVVDTYDQLDRVSKEIEKGKIGKVLEYENFYDLPNGNNGYRAIHFIIGVKKDGVLIPVEVQIKTKRVKKLAEASHTAYKNGNLDNAKNDELGVMVMKADKGDEAIAKEIDPLIADTKKLKKELTMEKRKKGGLLDDYLAKGGKVKAKREINEGLKELEEALAGASKKHKAQSKMVGQIQKGFDETFEEGGMLEIDTIYDNGGESADRYTLIDEDGDMYGIGGREVNIYLGNRSEFPSDLSYLGKIVEYEDLSDEVKKEIDKRLDTSNFAEGGLLKSDLMRFDDLMKKGESVVVSDKFDRDYIYNGSAEDYTGVAVMDTFDRLGEAHPETTYQIMPLSKIKSIRIDESVYAEGGKVKDKKRYDIDEYSSQGSRTTDNEYIERTNDFDELVEKITKRAKDKKIPYIEFYYKDSFIGSINEKNDYKFRIGRGFEDNPLESKNSSINKQRYKDSSITSSYAKGGKIKGRPTLKQMCNMYRNKR